MEAQDLTGAHRDEIRVVLADDHDLVRSGIRSLLRQIEGVHVVGEAPDGKELLERVQATRPDVVLTDVSMPVMDGIEATAVITRDYPEVRVLVLSMHDEADFVRRAVANGASGYLNKNSSVSALEQALRSVMSTGSYFSAAMAQRLMKMPSAAPEEELTARQMQILLLLAQGRTAKEIAFELDLSSKTVDVHRARVMRKLDLRDLTSLTRYAVRKGLVKL